MTDLTEGAPSKRTNAAKVRRAVVDPRRSGAECKAPGGAFVPIVNRGKCEAKGDCVDVCLYDVFEGGPIGENDYRALGWLTIRFGILSYPVLLQNIHPHSHSMVPGGFDV